MPKPRSRLFQTRSGIPLKACAQAGRLRWAATSELLFSVSSVFDAGTGVIRACSGLFCVPCIFNQHNRRTLLYEEWWKVEVIFRHYLLPGNVIDSSSNSKESKSNVWIHLAFIPWTVGVPIHGLPFCDHHSEIECCCQEVQVNARRRCGAREALRIASSSQPFVSSRDIQIRRFG